MDINNNQELMDVFYEETQELIDKMRKILSTLKDEVRTSNSELQTKEIFRYAHTIKSNAGTVGFKELRDMSMGMERLFKPVKDGESGINDGLISLAIEAVEDCQKLLKKEEPLNHKELLEKLDSVLKER